MPEKEYIERDTVIGKIIHEALHSSYHDRNGEARGLIRAKDLLQKAPTADVQEVKHGNWIEKEYAVFTSKCSVCGLSINEKLSNFYKYCPHCGAKMDGGEK